MSFRPINRQTDYLFPPSMNDWLPEKHLARFVVETVEELDLTRFVSAYRGTGSASYHPALLLSLLIYGYATGVFASRKIERATHDSVAFRYIAADSHPDHDTLATFRRRFLKEIEGVFVQVLLLAKELGFLKLGTVALDGTKVKANASRHSALSHGHATRLEEQLGLEVHELLALAETADQDAVPDGMSIPDEIARREARLNAIRAAKSKIEARAKERFEREQVEYQAKVDAREAKAAQTGKKPRGKPPTPPQAGTGGQDQVNLTDEESRILPVSGGGFEQGYNAQAAVDAESMLIAGRHLTQAANDKEQVKPMLAELGQLPQALGHPENLLADTGYFSAANVGACIEAKIEPLIAVGREPHHPSWKDRFTEPPALPEGADAVDAMKHRLKTREGRALYAARKRTVEPVFGIIKSVMGFRQFLLRGLEKASGEWNLVCLAWNMKRLFALKA